MKIKKLYRRVKASIKFHSSNTQVQSWSDIEHFDDAWKKRITMMSAHIPPDAHVVDLGCGKMWLKEIVPGLKYTGVDYRNRGNGCIVADFNKLEFPHVNGEVAFISGCLEYVENVEWFMDEIAKQFKFCIISYCCLEEFPDRDKRKRLGWVNGLTKSGLISLLGDRGFVLSKRQETDSMNSIFVFKKQD